MDSDTGSGGTIFHDDEALHGDVIVVRDDLEIRIPGTDLFELVADGDVLPQRFQALEHASWHAW